MNTRWETRYSSSEMMYLEIAGDSVRVWLNSNAADIYSFDDVLAGQLDSEVGGVFGSDTLKELRAAVQHRKTNGPPPPFDKAAHMKARRMER